LCLDSFNDNTAEKVFENILSRRINWHEDAVEVSSEARDLMERLLCKEPEQRLGANGTEEVKRHPFFRGINWAAVCTGDAPFVPQVTDPESTDYFDARGAIPHLFTDEEPAAVELIRPHGNRTVPDKAQSSEPASDPVPAGRSRQASEASRGSDDFGAFSFKNLDYFKQANDDVIRKMRNEMPLKVDYDGPPAPHARHLALGGKPLRRDSRVRERWYFLRLEIGLTNIVSVHLAVVVRRPRLFPRHLHLHRHVQAYRRRL
jgi:hypothetical protein